MAVNTRCVAARPLRARTERCSSRSVHGIGNGDCQQRFRYACPQSDMSAATRAPLWTLNLANSFLAFRDDTLA